MSELEILAQHLGGATTAAAWAVGAYVIAKWIFHTAIVCATVLIIIRWIFEFLNHNFNDSEISTVTEEEEEVDVR